MKFLLFPILLFPFLAFSQKDQKVNAPITKVTVFTSGAQVEHEKKVSLSSGKQVVVFEKLTDFVDPNSIQLKSSTNAVILSVRTRKNFDDIAIVKQDVDNMNVRRKKLELDERKLRDEYLILQYDEQLLLKNNDLGSQQQAVKIAELKEASTFYHTKMTEIQVRKSQLEKEIEVVVRGINEIEQEINTRRSLPVTNYTEIEVELELTQAGSVDFTFSYITPNAFWKPYYDMRSNGVGAPVLLEAKGLVSQNTGMEWKDVNLVLSTNDPYDNTFEPIIEPWNLNYYSPAPRKQIVDREIPTYNYSGETIFGEVLDASSGEPLSFAKISMANNPTMIISTDINGKFSFSVPRYETAYNVEYLGYGSQYISINSPYTKVLLYPEAIVMETANGTFSDGMNYGYATDESVSYDAEESLEQVVVSKSSMNKLSRKSKKENSRVYANSTVTGSISAGYAIPLATTIEKDLRMEFQISTPFTIPSDNADHRVAIAVYNLTANYEYHSVPKLDPNVYLVAQVSGWEKLNLLNGESNIYFDGTFIGKSYIDVNSAKDTLSFSLGKDRKMIVERKRSEEKSKTRAIGNRYKYEVTWDFTIRNNGATPIPFIMKDHFPVSINDDIKVKQGEFEGASLDEKTGILTWRLTIAKGETKKTAFNYSVEYSNNQPVYLE